MATMTGAVPPVIWSIAGNDSGGGAGLAADARAVAALGAHLCPVVASVTAQNSVAVSRVEPVSADVLQAQLTALAEDMPPAVIKTGLLGSAENVRIVAEWVDRLRAAAPVALVVDPVLKASSGASFADEEILAAYRQYLLPRASLLTPNEREARILGGAQGIGLGIPELARQLRAQGAEAVAVTGGDSEDSPQGAFDWIDTPQASGWLWLPRVRAPHTHGTGCTFASSAAAALALGFVAADALVLAKMACTHALRQGYAAGRGPGPVAAGEGFALQADLMPTLSWSDDQSFMQPGTSGTTGKKVEVSPTSSSHALDLYAIVDSADRVAQAAGAGIRTIQLRVKAPDSPADQDAQWQASLSSAIRESLAACQKSGALLIINDHWRLAHQLGVQAVHLGQEDLLALGESGRRELAATGMQVGISSHSLWELARARALAPIYVACGPVWPTLTKAMPWRPQGLDNLSWWVHMAGVPVVAIGGILESGQLGEAARTGASGVCIVRGLGTDPAKTVPIWQAALRDGRHAQPISPPALPHPSLPSSYGSTSSALT